MSDFGRLRFLITEGKWSQARAEAAGDDQALTYVRDCAAHYGHLMDAEPIAHSREFSDDGLVNTTGSSPPGPVPRATRDDVREDGRRVGLVPLGAPGIWESIVDDRVQRAGNQRPVRRRHAPSFALGRWLAR